MLLQDVAKGGGDDGTGATIKQGTVPGRMPSATDPDVRHGRKSTPKRFNGHKAAVVTDLESGIFVAFDVLGGDEADTNGAVALTKQAKANTGMKVEETIGDCAYRSGGTRQKFEGADRRLFAKVPPESANGGQFKTSDFSIDLKAVTAKCPAGHTPNRMIEHANWEPPIISISSARVARSAHSVRSR